MTFSGNLPEAIDALYRAESRQVLATLIRLLGDFDRAEEAPASRWAAGRSTPAQDLEPMLEASARRRSLAKQG